MSDFYWLRPEWRQQLCAQCGTNIWNSGGDPDWGFCYECFSEKNRIAEEAENQRKMHEQEYYEHLHEEHKNGKAEQRNN